MLAALFVAALCDRGFTLDLPARPAHSTDYYSATDVDGLKLVEREARFEQTFLSGDVPNYLRRFVPVPVERVIDGKTVRGRLFVAPDYLCVGEKPFTLHITPFTAQRIADRLGCMLPTPAMVDAIDAAATLKLTPAPVPPSAAMVTMDVFRRYNASIRKAMSDAGWTGAAGSLVCGTQKDVVICAGLAKAPGKVAIYGWRKPDGSPIQPLYLGHTANWVDYSHGVRLVAKTMEVDGRAMDVAKILRDPKLCALLSNEGVVNQPRYDFRAFPSDAPEPIKVPAGEKLEEFSPEPGVRVVVHSPTVRKPDSRLIIYALPNGNSIEQTFGRRARPGLDWHFDIQHIGAQTRFLQSLRPNESQIVAYVANDAKAWPTWVRGHDPKAAVRIIDAIIAQVGARKVALNSHSGGGALLFAYLREVESIPGSIDRIAFLDSEYNYDTDTHDAKLTNWLRKGDTSLCLLAYDDANALLDGKPFVSKSGGTWGRTHAMLRDLEAHFKFTPQLTTDPERYEALDGRITIWFKRNPTRAIFHTVLVERNGFIESMVSGTPLAGRGYTYFGPRAYDALIRD